MGFLAVLALITAPVVTPPPPSLRADPFYVRYLDADGIPVLASERVPPEALANARSIVATMLAARPDIAAHLRAKGQRVAVMAESEGTLDLPEQRDWKKPAPDDPRLTRCERKHYETRIGKLTDRQYWDARARGMGGPLTSVGAENLLGVRTDRYRGTSNLVHEFAHAILRAAFTVDPGLYARVWVAYSAAMAKGLWKGEYSSTNMEEYWAVGTQFWFNTARVAIFDDRQVLSDADLAAYDPALHAVLAEVYRGHRAEGDPYWTSPLRVPAGPLPKFTAEVC